MIGTRKHLEALLRAEKAWTNLLFTGAAGMVVFLYRELNRRQAITEKHEEERRAYVDGELTNLNNEALGHRERSQGRASIGRTVITVAGLVLTLATLWSVLLAAHVIG